MRRTWKSVFAAALGVGVLSGCFPYDEIEPGVTYNNDSSTQVRVRIVGAELDYEMLVASDGGLVGVTLDECIGTGIVVETEEGEDVGRIDEPACPGRTLTINPDLSLDYQED